MAITFGETFDKVQECFQEATIKSQLTQKLQSVTIIRDVYGAIRLFLEPVEGFKPQEADITNLDICLSQKLCSYYGKDIWLPEGEQDGYQALIKVITEERVSADWDDDTASPRWYLLERHIAKQAWTNKTLGNPPWTQELVDRGHKPAVVAFFSFKGGVGRTTALAATALTLARHGHRVAIVDLDLEAPGLATIFSPDTSDNFGAVDNNYLEKLARLDFQNLVNNELPETLREMLRELESAARPVDFILLDARAGFHDIGGLAIADLSHAAVIFGIQTRQSWAGLTHVIRRLAKQRASEHLPVLLSHAMAPQLGDSRREPELRSFRETAYDIFQKNYYFENESVPNSNDLDAPFMPVVLSLQDNLRGDIGLFSREQSLEDASRLSGLITVMTSQPYQKLAERLCLLFGRELKR